MSRETSPRWHYVVLAIAFGVVALGEIALIQRRELWLDESHTALLSTLPLRDLLSFVKGDVHPPLYFLLEAGWVRLFGDSELALRLPSTLAHLAGAAVFFAVARALWSSKTALFATALYLFNPALFYYASEARGYQLATLLVTATVACVVASEKAQSDRQRRWAVVGAIVFGAAAFYTHYVGLFVVAALFLAWLVHAIRSRRHVAMVFGAGVATCLLMAPWVPVLLRQQRTKAGLIATVRASKQVPGSLTFGAPNSGNEHTVQHLSGAVQDVASIAGIFPARQVAVLALLALPIVILGAFGLVEVVRGSWLAAACLVVIIANVAGMLALGVEARRYVLLSTPFIVLLLSFGADRLGRSGGGAIALPIAMVGLLGLNLAGTVRVLAAEQTWATKSLASIVAHTAERSDLVVFANAYAQIPFDYYARRDALRASEDGFPIAIRSWWKEQPFKGWGSRVATTTELQEYVSQRRARLGGGSLWLVLFEDHQYDPTFQVPKAFLADARSVADYGHCGKGPAVPCADSAWRVYRIQY